MQLMFQRVLTALRIVTACVETIRKEVGLIAILFHHVSMKRIFFSLLSGRCSLPPLVRLFDVVVVTRFPDFFGRVTSTRIIILVENDSSKPHRAGIERFSRRN